MQPAEQVVLGGLCVTTDAMRPLWVSVCHPRACGGQEGVLHLQRARLPVGSPALSLPVRLP